jgi:hypothetical protein
MGPQRCFEDVHALVGQGGSRLARRRQIIPAVGIGPQETVGRFAADAPSQFDVELQIGTDLDIEMAVAAPRAAANNSSRSSRLVTLTVQLSVSGPPRGLPHISLNDWPSDLPVRSCNAKSIPARVIGIPVLNELAMVRSISRCAPGMSVGS